jgi:hypothetical protein
VADQLEPDSDLNQTPIVQDIGSDLIVSDDLFGGSGKSYGRTKCG